MRIYTYVLNWWRCCRPRPSLIPFGLPPMDAPCPFCSPAREQVLLCNLLCYARYDGYPVSKGHLLIIPLRHVADFFDLSNAEQEAVLDLMRQSWTKLRVEFNPDGFNIGVNVGRAAGQTVEHVHLHFIPRYSGDVPDPRGGVRWVLPDRARYWSD